MLPETSILPALVVSASRLRCAFPMYECTLSKLLPLIVSAAEVATLTALVVMMMSLNLFWSIVALLLMPLIEIIDCVWSLRRVPLVESSSTLAGSVVLLVHMLSSLAYVITAFPFVSTEQMSEYYRRVL